MNITKYVLKITGGYARLELVSPDVRRGYTVVEQVLLVSGEALPGMRANGTDVGLVAGAATGLLMGVGFAATTSLGHRLMGGQGFVVWAIEVGGDIAALVAMGAILGAWQ